MLIQRERIGDYLVSHTTEGTLHNVTVQHVDNLDEPTCALLHNNINPKYSEEVFFATTKLLKRIAGGLG